MLLSCDSTVLVLFCCCIFIIGCSSKNNLRELSWAWTCDQSSYSCKRNSIIPQIPESQFGLKYDSYNECQLICSKYGSIWPMPTKPYKFSQQTIVVHPSKILFTYPKYNEDCSQFMTNIIEIFKDNLNKNCDQPCTASVDDAEVHVVMNYDSTDTQLKWDTNESYKLKLLTQKNVVTVELTAETMFGIRHGLESVSQLTTGITKTINSFSGNYTKSYLIMLSEAIAEDKPVYTHRGLLIDTARHFISIETLKRQIDGMAASKLNTLHWHATDSQSFPLFLPSIPELSRYGAYSQNEVYTQDNIRELINYAKFRGVRIIIEIDAPSHASFGWQFGPKYKLGNLAVCINKQPWKKYCIQPPCGQLNPVNENLYKMLALVFRDITDLFPSTSEVFHMGGDEVDFRCWNSTKEIVAYLQEIGMGTTERDFLNLWAVFQNKSLNIFDEQNFNNQKNTKIILWTSHLTDVDLIETYLDKTRYVIQTWVESTSTLPQDLLAKGYKLIMSTKNAWYLDHGFWGNTKYYNWKTVYQNKLLLDKNILGGEVCMWTEFVDDFSIDSRVWPRAAAAAERLWSNPKDLEGVHARLFKHRDMLIQRGISADVIQPEWCLENIKDCIDYHNTRKK